MNAELIKEIAVAFELIGGVNLSEQAMDSIIDTLDIFPPKKVRSAIAKCYREVRGRLYPADIVSRIMMDDGRPSADEAWAMLPRSESESVVWSDEMAEAYGVVTSIIYTDQFSARKSFVAAYQRIVDKNRDYGIAPHWTPSLGTYEPGRNQAIIDAVYKHRLSPAYARSICSDLPPMPGEPKQIEAHEELPCDEVVDDLINAWMVSW